MDQNTEVRNRFKNMHYAVFMRCQVQTEERQVRMLKKMGKS